jgi:hypothetical protein
VRSDVPAYGSAGPHGAATDASEGARKRREGPRTASAVREAASNASPTGVETPDGRGGTHSHPRSMRSASSERRETPREAGRSSAREARRPPQPSRLWRAASAGSPTPSSGLLSPEGGQPPSGLAFSSASHDSERRASARRSRWICGTQRNFLQRGDGPGGAGGTCPWNAPADPCACRGPSVPRAPLHALSSTDPGSELNSSVSIQDQY